MLALFDFFKAKNNRRNPGCALLRKKLRMDEERYKNVMLRLDGLEKLEKTIDNRQKEMVIQMEELDATINDKSEAHLQQLMALSDIIYDFLCYSKQDEANAAQAKLMWQGSRAALKKADIEVLEPTGEPFNTLLHIAYDTTNMPDIPHESIAETLKCGYASGSNILRRATVVVNKTNGGFQHDCRH